MSDTHPRLRRRPLLVVATLAVVVGLGIVVRLRDRGPSDEEKQARMQAALQSIRGAIATFRAKHGRPPRTLDELVATRTLGAIPADPITGSAASWVPTTEESVAVSADFTTGAPAKAESFVIDVRSGAAGTDAAGRPWSGY